MTEIKTKEKTRFSKFWKNYSNYIFFIFLISATSAVIFTQVDPATFFNTIKQTKIGFLIIGIACVFVFWILEAYMLLKLMRREKPNEKFSFAFTVTQIGQYYNLITPSATGGQPLQLYEMTKKGYNFGVSTAVLVQKYALYQITVTFLGIIATFFSIVALHQGLEAAKWLIIIGLLVNIVGVVFIIILAMKPPVAKKILVLIGKFLLKIRILKNKEKFNDKIDRFLGEYEIAINGLKSRKLETMQLLLISMIQMICFFSVNYWVYRSLGLHTVNAITIISLQAILYVAVAFVPTPGAAGGAEAGFLLIFGSIYGGATAPIAMILWRFITYYFIILFGGIYLSIHSIQKGKNIAEKYGNEMKEDINFMLDEKDKIEK
jgi:uncharacterized protein (TIRG00374 family)